MPTINYLVLFLCTGETEMKMAWLLALKKLINLQEGYVRNSSKITSGLGKRKGHWLYKEGGTYLCLVIMKP